MNLPSQGSWRYVSHGEEEVGIEESTETEAVGALESSSYLFIYLKSVNYKIRRGGNLTELLNGIFGSIKKS